MLLDIAATLLSFADDNPQHVRYPRKLFGVSCVSSSQRNISCLNSIGPYFAAKLGDTKELEDFIADLDRTLASKEIFISCLHVTESVESQCIGQREGENRNSLYDVASF